MPKRVLPLTEPQVKNAKPRQSDYKLSDGNGLFLLVTVAGGKLWRFRYQFGGKDKTLAMGIYPDVSLSRARTEREQCRQLVARGVDPAEAKKAGKLEEAAQRVNTFEKLAREWFDRQTSLVEKTRTNIMGRLERDVFPVIGDTTLDKLTSNKIYNSVLLPIEKRGAIDVAHRAGGIISKVLCYGVAKGVCERDLTIDIRGQLKPIPRNHHAALDAGGTTDPARVGGLLRALDEYDGSFVVKCALRFHPLAVTRPGELRHAEWQEIDFETATWLIPAGKMKMKNPHVVPLSLQAVEILRELQSLTGDGKYLFPSVRTTSRPISDNTMNAALRRLGYGSDDMVSHGWRAIFRTLADEVLQERVDIIEAQLAHKVADKLGRAYNRTSFLDDRRAMLQRWADYLGTLKAGGKVIPIDRKSA